MEASMAHRIALIGRWCVLDRKA